MRYLLGMLALLASVGASWAGFVLEPQVIPPGGVARVRWQGESPPPAGSSVQFNGKRLPLFSAGTETFALIGVDLDQAPGRYPLVVASGDAESELILTVQGEERPVDQLSLPKQMVTPTAPKALKRIDSERKQLKQLFAQQSAALRWGRFAPPLQGEIISTFGRRRILNGIEKAPHNGVDYRARDGVPVAAIGGGRVVLTSDLYYTGKTVVLDHGGGLFSVYAHLRAFAVRRGEEIKTGTIVGEVGSSGRATGPHLHLGLRLAGARVDPLALLGLFAGQTVN